MKSKLWTTWLTGMALAAGVAQAFEIASDQQIDGASPQIVGVGTGNTVVPSGAAPNWTFNWADRDGTGASNAVATAGLNLAAYKLYAAATDSLQGTITLDLNGGAIVGDDGVAIITSPGVGSGLHSHHLTIRNVGDIATGQILTYIRGTSDAAGNDTHPGHLTIGTEQNPAGHIRIGLINTGSLTAGTRSGQRGDVTIWGSGNVRIEDSLGNAGNIVTWPGSSGWRNVGHVKIVHDGAFRVNDILSAMANYSARKKPADITLDGGAGVGDCIVRDIDNRHIASGYGSSERGHIVIRNYANVSLRSIASQHTKTDSRAGGHVDIYNIAGNIEITGTIDCSSGHENVETYYGHLKLTAGGMVTLAELDLAKLLFATLSSGGGKSTIEGELLNFDAAGSGSGSLNDPVVTTQTSLRAPAGQRLLYKVRDDANAGLEGKVYRIANASGQAGQGGLLMPIPTRGTVLLFF